MRPAPLVLYAGAVDRQPGLRCLAFYLIVRGCPEAWRQSAPLCTFIYAMMTLARALVFVPKRAGGLPRRHGAAIYRVAGGAAATSAVGGTTLVIRNSDPVVRGCFWEFAALIYGLQRQRQVAQVMGAIA